MGVLGDVAAPDEVDVQTGMGRQAYVDRYGNQGHGQMFNLPRWRQE
jgi:hypothetical protein